MEMVLLDWTRMGRVYCLAGGLREGNAWRIVRPLPAKFRDAPVRNAGWSPFQIDGHQRWEIIELVGPTPAPPQPPPLEDMWVRSLRPTGQLASMDQRRAFLQATCGPGAEPPFGVPWTLTAASAFIEAGAGSRSLASLVVRATDLRFTACWRQGSREPDIRVHVAGAGLAGRSLPVKDHYLLARAEQAGDDLQVQLQALEAAVRAMGEQILVRIGLSRAFPSSAAKPDVCWLMADGFFSLTDPQP